MALCVPGGSLRSVRGHAEFPDPILKHVEAHRQELAGNREARRCRSSTMEKVVAMAERHYVHVGGEEGRDRLRVLARIFAPATAALLDRIEIVAGMRCLDVGCGGGDVSVELARRVGPGGAVIAIDFDGESLDIARREALQAGHDNLIYRQCDLFDLGLDKPIDVVYTRFVLTHLQDPVTALSEDGRTASPWRKDRHRGCRCVGELLLPG